MKTFGSSNSQQSSTQTGDDNLEVNHIMIHEYKLSIFSRLKFRLKSIVQSISGPRNHQPLVK